MSYTFTGLDVHRDTLVEILHTWSLGGGKYAWHKSTTTWNEQQLTVLSVRLQSSSVDGLSVFPIRGEYLVKYRNALVGKHLKAIQQVIAFHVHSSLDDPLLLALWRATGEMGALLHYHKIDDLETYLVCQGTSDWMSLNLLTIQTLDTLKGRSTSPYRQCSRRLVRDRPPADY